MDQSYVLSMTSISKTFPGVKALSNVNFHLRKGEIHALMGENGAGKSTLIKVLTGVYELESGEILMDGSDKPIVNHSPQAAQESGISTVYQEVNLCPNLTVAENLFIGREPRMWIYRLEDNESKIGRTVRKTGYRCISDQNAGRMLYSNSTNDCNSKSC